MRIRTRHLRSSRFPGELRSICWNRLGKEVYKQRANGMSICISLNLEDAFQFHSVSSSSIIEHGNQARNRSLPNSCGISHFVKQTDEAWVITKFARKLMCSG